jgi:predicted branched-subunit amino acid permease
VAAAVSAALIVGARHLLYSANLAPLFQQQPRWFRWLGPYMLIDQVFALALLNRDFDPRAFRTYYLTIGGVFWTLWLLFTALGVAIGPQVPSTWKLAFAAPVLFVGLVVVGVDRWQKALVAVSGAALTFLLADLPSGSGMLIGALAAIALGMLADALRGPVR